MMRSTIIIVLFLMPIHVYSQNQLYGYYRHIERKGNIFSKIYAATSFEMSSILECDRLFLYSDSTLKLITRRGCIGTNYSGIWRIDDDTLSLKYSAYSNDLIIEKYLLKRKKLFRIESNIKYDDKISKYIYKRKKLKSTKKN